MCVRQDGLIHRLAAWVRQHKKSFTATNMDAVALFEANFQDGTAGNAGVQLSQSGALGMDTHATDPLVSANRVLKLWQKESTNSSWSVGPLFSPTNCLYISLRLFVNSSEEDTTTKNWGIALGLQSGVAMTWLASSVEPKHFDGVRARFPTVRTWDHYEFTACSNHPVEMVIQLFGNSPDVYYLLDDIRVGITTPNGLLSES